jgi:hypothetical protein
MNPGGFYFIPIMQTPHAIYFSYFSKVPHLSIENLFQKAEGMPGGAW